MLVIRRVDPAQALPAFWGLPPRPWHAYCTRRGLLTFTAEQDGDLTGYAVAESHPRAVYVLDLVGDIQICRLLLDRLVRAAGERDVAGWFTMDRPDLGRVLVRLGFARVAREDFHGRPSHYYHWHRNRDVWLNQEGR